MKKIASVLMMLALAATTALAQPGYGPRFNSGRPGYGRGHDRGGHFGENWYTGIKFGLVGSHVSSDSPRLDSDGVASGFSFGLAAGFNLAPVAAFETGLYYTEKGGRNHSGDSGGKITYDLNYIEIPLILKCYIRPDGRSAVFQPFAGAYLGLGIGGQVKDYDAKLTYGSFGNDYFKRGDSGLTFGCGVSWSFLYASLGYEYGLANTASNSFSETHNRALVFSVGFAF